MASKRKRLKVYSITSVLSFLLLLTFTNISWKAAPNTTEVNFTDTETKVKIVPTAVEDVNVLSNHIQNTYETLGLANAGLDFDVFEKALIGYINIKSQDKLSDTKEILTIVDFNKESTAKRMWIVDLKNKTLLLNTYVAHGRGSGLNMANTFSNYAESHQSSLGFYVTNETYFGKHGLSLKLDGMEKGINDQARNRAIVVHGANYVSASFIKQTGRLGRSHGCPAVPEAENEMIINFIKGKTCLFINGSSQQYQSNLINKKLAEEKLATLMS